MPGFGRKNLHKMSNYFSARQIQCVQHPKYPNVIVGDVFDTLEDGTPHQWEYEVFSIDTDEGEKWLARYKRDVITPDSIVEINSAKVACYAHRCELLESIVEDNSKGVAVKGLCFIQEIINDLIRLNYWQGGQKFQTMLEDWKSELMEIAEVEEDEIRDLHAELCGAHNWGLEDDEDE